MDTLTAIRKGEIVLPVAVQIMFGGCPIDPDFIEVYRQQPRWDEQFDDMLDARMSSL